jgi:hypothetical protein
MTMRFLFGRKVVAAVAVGIGLLGCGPTRMYTGPALSADRVAVLEITNMTVFALDTSPVSGSKLEILPGEHEIRASHNLEGYPEQLIAYVFTAQAGRRYILGADYEIKRGLSWRPWIKDAATGETVGNLR